MRGVKLQDELNRRVGDKEYRKWFVNLSKEHVERLQWAKGQELDVRIRGRTLTLRPAKGSV